MQEGKVSSKYQLTLPVQIRRALGIKPGDTVRYEVREGKLSLTVARPDVGQVLERLWAEHDTAALHAETGGDAVDHMREHHGLDVLSFDDTVYRSVFPDINVRP